MGWGERLNQRSTWWKRRHPETITKVNVPVIMMDGVDPAPVEIDVMPLPWYARLWNWVRGLWLKP